MPDFKMVNLKLNKKDAVELTEAKPSTEDMPRFPWGTALNLDEETLSRLGIDKLPEVGGELMIVGKVSVTRASSSSSLGDKKRRSLELQLTDMGLGEVEKEKAKDHAETIYGKGKE